MQTVRDLIIAALAAIDALGVSVAKNYTKVQARVRDGIFHVQAALPGGGYKKFDFVLSYPQLQAYNKMIATERSLAGTGTFYVKGEELGDECFSFGSITVGTPSTPSTALVATTAPAKPELTCVQAAVRTPGTLHIQAEFEGQDGYRTSDASITEADMQALLTDALKGDLDTFDSMFGSSRQYVGGRVQGNNLVFGQVVVANPF